MMSFHDDNNGVLSARRLTFLSRRRPSKRFSLYRRQPISRRRSSAGDQTVVDEPLDYVDLDWYGPWVARQRARLPVAVNALLDQEHRQDASDGFQAVWNAIHVYLQTNRDASIDEIVAHLEDGVLCAADNTILAKRLLVFSILGWQSMVFLPELNSHAPGTLAVQHDPDGPDSGLVYDRYVIAAASAADMCERPLWVMLKWFGNLLPAHPSELAVAGAADVAAFERGKSAASWTALYPDQLNAHLLHTLLRVNFRWVDSLALHLDYDKSTRTLSLFAYPSMCVAHLRGRKPQSVHADDENEMENKSEQPPAGGTIFALSSREFGGADPRADEDDIAHFLQEVLVSYRLLFGQSAKARRLFRDVYAPAVAPFHQPDTLLPRLCGFSSSSSSSACCPGLAELPPDRAIYYAARDFSVLYRRIELLADELSGARPTSIRDLLNDRRDTLQFWTFWLVSVFGSASILLALVQTILQAVSIAQAAGKI